MKYTNLKKTYYKNQSDPNIWLDEYTKRFNSISTKHLDFQIKEYGYKNSNPAFYCYTEEITTLINEILAHSIDLIKFISSIPQIAILKFLNLSLISEVKSSNEIEGIKSTRREINEVLSQVTPKEYMRLWGIVNKYKKIVELEHINLGTCEDIRALYDDFLLKEIKRDNPKNAPDGKLFRLDSVDVVTSSQKTIHRGEYPEDKIIESLNEALLLLENKQIPLLIRISIFHYLFGYIHPFYDGNGRMARFITSYFLAKEIHPIVALHLSYLIKRNRSIYYKLFEDTTSDLNKGDLTPFITGSLELILNSILSVRKILTKRLTTFRKYQKLLDKLSSKDKLTVRVYNILLQAAVFSDFGATLEEIASPLNKSTKTIKSRIDEIPLHEITVDKTSKPYHYKINLSYLNNITK